MLSNLKFLSISAYKSKESKLFLAQYLDFLECVATLYERFATEKEWLAKIKQYVNEMRREFDLILKDTDRTKMIKQAENQIWNITPEDLAGNIKPSVTDTLLMKYRQDEKYKGIMNIGNTCYLASTMQSLFMTVHFKERLIDLMKEVGIRHDSPLQGKIDDLMKEVGTSSKSMSIEKSNVLKETQNMFYELISTQKQAVDPGKFKAVLPSPFDSSKLEQDAMEFLQEYFDCIEQQLKNTKQKNLIDELFAGEIKTILECQECHKGSSQNEKFLNMSLAFDEDDHNNDQI
eukprot:CAMPEP_0114602138 /NCGR_PEP_ID=MMETSP0125-20121206/24754_1 /TAXON_ID=485358 ORGANISM="Aristerostoma sp., Strain ATCC 50986" /NCGR_SAMPLE_ID=MMETSP0125 /ASSEMBLY_ACC=CAM_ASM_000245 /LENGTH=288 /DNA_ID=CAMNT_0001812061 /DNA_START=818 /DNA_END=1685 /DNA_ORIENTATION=+